MNWTLVTGAAKGLGAAICIELAKKGYPVLIHYRRSLSKAEEVRNQCVQLGVPAEMIQGDFATGETTAHFIAEATSRFQNIENLINNVGNYRVESFCNTPLMDWYELFQTNVFSVIQLIQGFKGSISANKGSIINIGVVGIQSVPADSYSPAYTASKMTLWMITKTLAKELKEIRVNMISPGYLQNAVDLPKDLSCLPQGRAVSFSEVANLIPFLFENLSITGQNIEVAGGVRL